MEKIKKSKELKEQIRRLELEREEDATRLKTYFRPSPDNNIPGSIVKNIIYSARVPLDLKSMVIKTIVSLATEFLIKKIFTKKEVYSAPKINDIIVNNAIDNAVSRNANELNEEEKRLFKKMLHQYLVSK